MPKNYAFEETVVANMEERPLRDISVDHGIKRLRLMVCYKESEMADL